MDAEDGGRPGDRAAAVFEDPSDFFVPDVIERSRWGGGVRQVTELSDLNEAIGGDALVVAEDMEALDHGAKLADVAWPVIGAKHGEGVSFELELGLAIELGEFVVEERDEAVDLIHAFAQGWNMQADDIEPEEQILPETFFSHLGGEVAVGGGDDADIDDDGTRMSDRLDLPVLQEAEETRLGRGGQESDLVEEQGSVLGSAHETHVLGGGAAEGSLDVSKELTVDDPVGDRAAVDGHDRSLGKGAVGVQPARQVTLADPRLARDEDRAG